MHQRELSATTLSKSDTNRVKNNSNLTPVQFVKGVGPKLASILEQRGIYTVGDLLLQFPKAYQDRSDLASVSDLSEGQWALLKGTIKQVRQIPIGRSRQTMLEALFVDSTGSISLKWFHFKKHYLDKVLETKDPIFIYGQVKKFGNRLEIMHPSIEQSSPSTETPDNQGNQDNHLKILPLYVESDLLTQKTWRKIITQALSDFGNQIEDDLPSTIRMNAQLLPMDEALQLVHFPKKNSPSTMNELADYRTPQQIRFIFEDFFKFELIMAHKRWEVRKHFTQSLPFRKEHPLWAQFTKSLPFQLTEDQEKSIDQIFHDLGAASASSHSISPMNRLLLGDVGCGKTLVSFASCLPLFAYDKQAALLAPTEILAYQHYVNAQKYLSHLGYTTNPGSTLSERKFCVEFLSGSTSQKKRTEIAQKLRSGEISLLIGTHAIIEDWVQFDRLSLVIIDEQHRFGVDQRLRLRKKGGHPHLLSMTATPIPRTLALTSYGDLDLSIIKTKPSNRPGIQTKLIHQNQKLEAYDLIRDQLKSGHQCYIIYPLVEESEKIDLANAVHGAEELANGPLYGHRIGLLHGRMKPEEKTATMDRFKAGEIDVLVSTTVIEVGVDVPNATVLLIEDADRFGLSQLHQLRGRVGRGQWPSYCFLCTHQKTNSNQRLIAMEQTDNGFKLAEMDLKIRGPGEFLGTRQSGELAFPMADLIRDEDILISARKAAFSVLKMDPQLTLQENKALRQFMIKKGALQQERLGTG